MKAKRRQELKTNDLAQFIDDLRDGFQDWGVYVIGGISAVIVIAAIAWYIKDARASADAAAYVELGNALNIAPADIRKSDEEIQAGLERLADYAEDNGDENFKLQAAFQRANLAMQLAVSEDGKVNGAYLDQAEGGFQTILDQFRDRPIYYGRALYGLFEVEADRFVLDQDSQHKAKAKDYLEQLRDDSRLAGTPLVAAAIDRLNNLDELFTPVVMVSPPPTPLLPPDKPEKPADADKGMDEQAADTKAPGGEINSGTAHDEQASPTESEDAGTPGMPDMDADAGSDGLDDSGMGDPGMDDPAADDPETGGDSDRG